jgi:hypothetical protein
MIITGILSFIVFILICVGLGGASTTDENVANCAWAFADLPNDYTSYIGLKRGVTQDNDGDTTSSWNWDDCNGLSYCNDCEDGGNSALNSIALAFVLSIPILVMTFLRSTNARDLNLYKILTLVFGLISLLLFIIAMGTFGDGCYDNLPSGQDYEYGPGFNAIAACFVFELFIVLFHLLTPVKKSADSAPADNYTSA